MCDGLNIITSLNPRPRAGGVCIYVANILANHTVCIDECSTVITYYKIITLVTTRQITNVCFVTIGAYKLPEGNIGKCTKFLYGVFDDKLVTNKEIWILGDLNTNLPKRDNPNTVILQRFSKKKRAKTVGRCNN